MPRTTIEIVELAGFLPGYLWPELSTGMAFKDRGVGGCCTAREVRSGGGQDGNLSGPIAMVGHSLVMYTALGCSTTGACSRDFGVSIADELLN